MNNFGIWIDEKKNQEEYIDMFDFKELNLIKIQEKDQLKEIDGLIFVLSDKNNVIKMVEWLFEGKTNPALFMWVFSEDGLDNEEEVLINLGVDCIFTSKENIKLFVLSMLNTTKKLMNYSKKKAPSESFFIKDEGKIVINQREVFLTKKESNLFSFLYKNKNNTVFYNEITSEIWPQNNKSKKYIIANLVFHLREKIKESRELELVTVRGRGYMLRNKKS